MKRDECNGALHEIPMREVPQRSKCYILISTVTLCYSLRSPEGHITDRVMSMKHNVVTFNSPSAGMRAKTGDLQHATIHTWMGGGGVVMLCAYLPTEGGEVCT